jgi:two-component system response regulator GlrR
MDRIGILLLMSNGARNLALSLKGVLEEGRLFDLDITEELLPDERLADHSSISSSAIAHRQPNIVMLCLEKSCPTHVKTVFGLLQKQLPGVPIIFATESGEPKELCRLLEQGASDCITAPFRSSDLLPRLWRLCQRRSQDDPVVRKLKEKLGLKQLVGESPAWLAEIKKVPAVAQCDASVLITGETGTGKEMVARAIHHLSPRSAKPFVAVNCGGIPVDLVENELFGHESGAFTGANSSSVGLVEKADGGSLFLDEIDCLPLLAQAKLLRFLQEKEIRPLGANKTCRVDVRVIAASNANLEEAVLKGRLRQDLFFRLNVILMALPPLRERKADIPLLARHFLAKYASAFGAGARDLSRTALQKLELYDWPGNIRELENVIERSVVLCPQTVLGPQDIQLGHAVRIGEGDLFQARKAKVIAQFERAYLHDLLREHHGNISRAATAAGKNRRAFWALMRKHQISVQPQPAS